MVCTLFLIECVRLCRADISAAIPLSPGTVCFFASNRLYHYSLEGGGERNSIVFIQHQRMMDSAVLSPAARLHAVINKREHSQVGSDYAAQPKRRQLLRQQWQLECRQPVLAEWLVKED